MNSFKDLDNESALIYIVLVLVIVNLLRVGFFGPW